MSQWACSSCSFLIGGMQMMWMLHHWHHFLFRIHQRFAYFFKNKTKISEQRPNWVPKCCTALLCHYSSHEISKPLKVEMSLRMTNPTNWCAPSKDTDQPGHPPSLIRVFAVCMKKLWILSYPLSAKQRLWSDWADGQADLSLCWMHMSFHVRVSLKNNIALFLELH